MLWLFCITKLTGLPVSNKYYSNYANRCVYSCLQTALQKKKRAYWQVTRLLSHNCPIFTIQFSLIERSSYAIGGCAGQFRRNCGDMANASFVVNPLLWTLGSAGSRWTKPWRGWLWSLSCCCQHVWPSRSTSRASLTSCWRTRAQRTWLPRMIPSCPASGRCAPSAASATSVWCSAPTWVSPEHWLIYHTKWATEPWKDGHLLEPQRMFHLLGFLNVYFERVRFICSLKCHRFLLQWK